MAGLPENTRKTLNELSKDEYKAQLAALMKEHFQKLEKEMKEQYYKKAKLEARQGKAYQTHRFLRFMLISWATEAIEKHTLDTKRSLGHLVCYQSLFLIFRNFTMIPLLEQDNQV